MKRIFCRVTVLICIIGCVCMNANAANNALLPDMVSETAVVRASGETAVVRASGSFDSDVQPGKILALGNPLPLAAGETVSIRANYTPENASMDFGLVDENSTFYHINTKTGSINQKIEVVEKGNYTFAIRNNSSVVVKVAGIIRY